MVSALAFYSDNLSLNPGEVYSFNSVICLKRTKINEKEVWDVPFFKKYQANYVFFENGPSPPSFLFIFVFSNKHYNFTTNKCEKCSSSIRHWDSNPRPLEHESPPITIRPGLPPQTGHFLITYVLHCIQMLLA